MKTSAPANDAAPYLVLAAGAVVVAGQLLVILSFAVGWLLITSPPTYEQLETGDTGFRFDRVKSWADDSSAYAVLAVLVSVVVAMVWFRRDRLQSWLIWVVFAGLVLVIPAQQTVLGSIFN